MIKTILIFSFLLIASIFILFIISWLRLNSLIRKEMQKDLST